MSFPVIAVVHLCLRTMPYEMTPQRHFPNTSCMWRHITHTHVHRGRCTLKHSNSSVISSPQIKSKESHKKRAGTGVAQSCLTLCDPMDYTVHGILQARILEWVTIRFFRGSSQPREWTQVSHPAADFLLSEQPGKQHILNI